MWTGSLTAAEQEVALPEEEYGLYKICLYNSGVCGCVWVCWCVHTLYDWPLGLFLPPVFWWWPIIVPSHSHLCPSLDSGAAVQRVEVGTLERAVKLSSKDAKLTKEHLRPLQVRRRSRSHGTNLSRLPD